MTFADFVKEFETAYVCHLTPDVQTDEAIRNKVISHDLNIHKTLFTSNYSFSYIISLIYGLQLQNSWSLVSYNEQWIKGKNAGGGGTSLSSAGQYTFNLAW